MTGEDVREWAQVDASRIRALVALLGPDEMTPTATRQFLAVCEEAEAEMEELAADLPPTPSFTELGFTEVGRCSDCGVECFHQSRWSHFGQDGIDHAPQVDPESIHEWPVSGGSAS